MPERRDLLRRARKAGSSLAGTIEGSAERLRERAPDREQLRESGRRAVQGGRAVVADASGEIQQVLEDGSGRKDSPSTVEVLANAERIGEIEAPVDASADPIGDLGTLNGMARLDGTPGLLGGMQMDRRQPRQPPRRVRRERRVRPREEDSMVAMGGLDVSIGGFGGDTGEDFGLDVSLFGSDDGGEENEDIFEVF